MRRDWYSVLKWRGNNLCEPGRKTAIVSIVRDEKCPETMWRVRMPDGWLSDMVNKTRARDAARSIASAIMKDREKPKEVPAEVPGEAAGAWNRRKHNFHLPNDQPARLDQFPVASPASTATSTGDPPMRRRKRREAKVQLPPSPSARPRTVPPRSAIPLCRGSADRWSGCSTPSTTCARPASCHPRELEAAGLPRAFQTVGRSIGGVMDFDRIRAGVPSTTPPSANSLRPICYARHSAFSTIPSFRS